MLVNWKENNRKFLECRKFYFRKKYNEWVMGGNSAIGIEQLNAILENLDEIKKALSQ